MLADRRPTLLFLLCAAAATAIYARVLPPELFHFAGTDASNYEGKSLALVARFEGARRFYPPGIAAADYPLLDAAFTDGRGASGKDLIGLMTSFVAVSRDRRVEFPHYHLYPWLMALWRFLRLDGIAERLNYFLLFASTTVLFRIVLRVGGSSGIAAAAGLLFLSFPSLVIGARMPLSEATALALQLFMIDLFLSARRGWRALAPYLLAPLMWTRLEFSLVAFAYALWAGVEWRRNLCSLVVLWVDGMACFAYGWICNRWYVSIFPNPVLVALGPLLPIPFLVGAASAPRLSRLAQAIREFVFARWTATVVSACVAMVALDWCKVHLIPEGRNYLGLFGHPRYPTASLLALTVGAGVLLLCVVGLIASGRRVFDALPTALKAALLPQLLVFVDLGSSPPNPWYWTRRLHALVLPAAALFAAFGVSSLHRILVRRLPTAAASAAAVLLVVACAAVNVSKLEPELGRVLTPQYLEAFDRAAGSLGDDTLVVLGRGSYAQKAQLPFRVRSAQWSFVLWNDRLASEALGRLVRTGRPLYVEEQLANQFRIRYELGGLRKVPVILSPSEQAELTLVRVLP